MTAQMDYSELMSFIGSAKDYARYCTDAPIEFSEVMAIQVLGFALGRGVVNRIQPKAVYHNSYTALLGPSTKARKDTIQELIGSDIVPIEYYLPSGGSPEGFLEELSEHNNGFQFMGEWSKELKGIKSGSYMADFAEVKNDLFNCKRYRKRLTSKQGKKCEFIIEEPYLCVNTTITPAVLKEKLTTEMKDGGYFPRYIIVSGELHPRDRGRLKKKALSVFERLRNQFQFVVNLDKENCVFELSDEALKFYNSVVCKELESEEFENVSACAGRIENYVVSFADILLVSEALGAMFYSGIGTSSISKLVELVELVKLVESIKEYEGGTNPSNPSNPTNPTNLTNPDGQNVMVVQKRYVEEAWRILKKCLYNAKEIADFVDMGKELAKVREYLMKHSDWVSHSVVMRNTNVDAEQMENARKTLIDRDEIETELRPVARRNNTETKAWFYKWRET